MEIVIFKLLRYLVFFWFWSNKNVRFYHCIYIYLHKLWTNFKILAWVCHSICTGKHWLILNYRFALKLFYCHSFFLFCFITNYSWCFLQFFICLVSSTPVGFKFPSVYYFFFFALVYLFFGRCFQYAIKVIFLDLEVYFFRFSLCRKMKFFSSFVRNLTLSCYFVFNSNTQRPLTLKL